MKQYINGNSVVELFDDGTRIITTNEGDFQFEYPLNIDIRVSTKCAFGLDQNTGKSFCSFCHESARTDGNECDYMELQKKLYGLPKGIELAIGANEITVGLCSFIFWCYNQEYVVNLTINQGHLKRDEFSLKSLIEYGWVKGLGISYRSSLNWRVPEFVLEYENTVFHVIAGIDTVDDVLSLKERGVRKVLVLGEKDFGFNSGKVDLNTRNHKEWYWWVAKLFNTFDVVSFDNLALQQLNIRRFFTDQTWEVFNQNEHSFYINAVDKYFSPSSRSSIRTPWDDISVPTYFKSLV